MACSMVGPREDDRQDILTLHPSRVSLGTLALESQLPGCENHIVGGFTDMHAPSEPAMATTVAT